MFTPTWWRFPFWLIFFRWVETTNQVFKVRWWNIIGYLCDYRGVNSPWGNFGDMLVKRLRSSFLGKIVFDEVQVWTLVLSTDICCIQFVQRRWIKKKNETSLRDPDVFYVDGCLRRFMCSFLTSTFKKVKCMSRNKSLFPAWCVRNRPDRNLQQRSSEKPGEIQLFIWGITNPIHSFSCFIPGISFRWNSKTLTGNHYFSHEMIPWNKQPLCHWKVGQDCIKKDISSTPTIRICC